MQTTTLEANQKVMNLNAAVEEAISRIAPLWPLSHFVAVNPYVGLTQRRFEDACGMIAKSAGVLPLQTPAEYLDALRHGRVQIEDLREVADEQWPVDRLIEALVRAPEKNARAMMTFADFLDSQRPHAHWEVLVEDEISKWCGVAFDENQTTWVSPWKTLGLFAAWREAASHDRNPEAYGLQGFRAFVKSLPDSADAVIAHCMQILEQPGVDAADFLHRQLMTISGWAGYLQYQAREERMRGGQNTQVKELLAIRLAYDAALHTAFVRDGSQRVAWRRRKTTGADRHWIEVLARWQTAYERSYQRKLAGKLVDATGKPRESGRPVAQAVFCIDVRSERIRRHLEDALPGVSTIGFAGFFGFPIAHRPTGRDKIQSRCPVLLVPPLECPDVRARDHAHGMQQTWSGKRAWKAFQNSAASCFTFVETVGLGFAARLLGRGGAQEGCCSAHAVPDLDAMPMEQLVSMAEGALRNMSLTSNFARLVLICGHGSHSSNNPYASALDCGACGGHAGDLNARLAAMVLNRTEVRGQLAAKGIAIPADTVFVSGLHDTLSDMVTVHGEEVPESHHADLATLRKALLEAAKATRLERACSLGLGHLADAALDAAIHARGNDISQVRPEWGLANNAALVVGSRKLTQGISLDGRVFLHDYDAKADVDLKVLKLILCAPVVVASWINLQYYASRVNPDKFGSGDKVLHNVSGGIGVMEGNGGDLRTGLPLQSIHDGERFIHEPMRLTVLIEAPCDSISAVLAALPEVKQLFDHGWIHLLAIRPGQAHRYSGQQWQLIPTP